MFAVLRELRSNEAIRGISFGKNPWRSRWIPNVCSIAGIAKQ
jgi:hypothetical protein